MKIAFPSLLSITPLVALFIQTSLVAKVYKKMRFSYSITMIPCDNELLFRDRPIYRFTDIFPDIEAFYHYRLSVLKKKNIGFEFFFFFFFFFCHIHNYTEFNQQWNLFSAFDPSKCAHTWSSGHTHTHTHTHTLGAVGTHTHLEQWTLFTQEMLQHNHRM